MLSLLPNLAASLDICPFLGLCLGVCSILKLISRLLCHRSSNYQECIHFCGNLDYINNQIRNYICSFITKMHTPPTNQLFYLALVAELPWDECQENEELISELFSENLNVLRQLSACRILQMPVIFLTAVIIQEILPQMHIKS